MIVVVMVSDGGLMPIGWSMLELFRCWSIGCFTWRCTITHRTKSRANFYCDRHSEIATEKTNKQKINKYKSPFSPICTNLSDGPRNENYIVKHWRTLTIYFNLWLLLLLLFSIGAHVVDISKKKRERKNQHSVVTPKFAFQHIAVVWSIRFLSFSLTLLSLCAAYGVCRMR